MGKPLLVLALMAALALPAPRAAALDNEDLLALVAMPLAVAAVSEMTDVPMHQLMDVVTLLNDAAVPPPQFIEVVRYAPVALVVENDEPDFVEFVRLREQEGLRGTALVTSIEERLRIYDLPDLRLVEVTAPRIVQVIDDDDFIPAIVRTRVAEAKAHPHGGPPGQLKKVAGVQTGAEIVHGTRRPVVRVGDDDDRDRGERRVVKQKEAKERKQPKASRVDRDDDGRGKGKGKGKDKGKGKG